MQKFLITRKSYNRKTGPIMVTTSPRMTCPTACPLRKTARDDRSSGCYAEHGFLGGFIWSKLDRLNVGDDFKKGQIKVHSLETLLQVIRDLPEGTLWRHNQAGDLYSTDQETIDERSLALITEANTGRRGFTYTHYDVLDNLENRRLVREANQAGFTVNLSANDEAHAWELARLNIAPVTTILPADACTMRNHCERDAVIICPASLPEHKITCAECGICAKQRKAIIGFPALGKKANEKGVGISNAHARLGQATGTTLQQGKAS
ncbi:DUF7227 family protein [Pontivivens insulae]|uniref:DUF7227 domain-containing protein n=1 Tax=Pontivivens insulae TaxID=1639689 RepID=A0A2R8ACJ2_9RHOB|nr:hypothetical protein [Pontivivens insulae]RED13909.1 hypothetical protein DFR53_1257 [Pontivivens insulae]SPF29983.1 hypothetical protein POI8812_02310 [Pontivivens insulae]